MVCSTRSIATLRPQILIVILTISRATMAPALGPSHRFIVKGDIVNDLLKGIGNVVNPKRVFRELTDFKPGEFVLITVMLLAQLVSFFVSKDFPRQVELV